MNILFLLKPKCNVAYLNQSDTIRQGLEKMRHHGYTAIPVIDDNGIYVGTITEGDFLWNILSLQKPQVQTGTSTLQYLEQYGIANLIRTGWNTAINIYTNMEQLLERVMDQNFVPVIDDRNVFVGIITRKDVIQYFVQKEQRIPEQLTAVSH